MECVLGFDSLIPYEVLTHFSGRTKNRDDDYVAVIEKLPNINALVLGDRRVVPQSQDFSNGQGARNNFDLSLLGER